MPTTRRTRLGPKGPGRQSPIRFRSRCGVFGDRRITGQTLDSGGSPLGSCVVKLYRTSDDSMIDTQTSDGSGNFSFSAIGDGTVTYYVVAYKAGGPDVEGTTVNTLIGA